MQELNSENRIAQQVLRDAGVECGDDPRSYTEILQGLGIVVIDNLIEITTESDEQQPEPGGIWSLP